MSEQATHRVGCGCPATGCVPWCINNARDRAATSPAFASASELSGRRAHASHRIMQRTVDNYSACLNREWQLLGALSEWATLLGLDGETASPADIGHAIQRLTAAVGERDVRQQQVADWTTRTFGPSTMQPSERVARFMEEAIELAQACGVQPSLIEKLTAHVYAKPVGEPSQEMGGVGITLLALAASLGFSAEVAERTEWARVEAIPAEHFRKRHNLKADAGISIYTDAAVTHSAAAPEERDDA